MSDPHLPTKRLTPPRPRSVKVALAVMLGALVADALRSVWASPATVHLATPSRIVSTVVSCVIGGAIILGVALRQRWAAILYGILVCIGASLILVIGVPGSALRSLFDWATAVAEVAAVCLLFSPSAREWFAAGRPDKRFPPLWHPDPTGRHQYRYWDGRSWTAYVSDDGGQSLDSPPPVTPGPS